MLLRYMFITYVKLEQMTESKTVSDDTEGRLDVLDHGFCRLVDHMGSDISIVRAARVSYDADWRAGENEGSDHKLINYLWRNKHTSPFESVSFTFEVKAPIFVLRQWHRHRTWSYNELSARYKELPEEFYVPDPDKLGKQHDSHKQVRDFKTEIDIQKQRDMTEIIRDSSQASFNSYKYLIKEGVPRELARSVLPVNTYSHMFASVNLLNLLRFITLRDHEHAQYEIRVYAEAMKKLVTDIVPVTMKAFDVS